MKFRISDTIYSMFIIALVIVFLFQVFLVWMFFISPEGHFQQLFMFCLTIICYSVFFFLRKNCFSIIIINEEGVENRCFASKPIKMKWDDISDLGIGYHNQGYGYNIYWIYFSKEKINKFHSINKYRINDNFIRMQYSQNAILHIRKFHKNIINNLFF